MTDVIQIFKYKELFTKETYTPQNRKHLNDLPVQISSTTGFLKEETVYLPLSKQKPGSTSPDLLIIQDLLAHDIPGDSWLQESRKAFRTIFHQDLYLKRSFELFKLKKSAEDRYDLHLDYESNSGTIGFPQRQDHKLCELIPGQPVRFRINGKSDFSLTGRKERTFHEFDYVIEWLGKAEKIEFLDTQRTKDLPLKFSNVINERKLLR
ncbi:hypothetical protein [Salinimicrobium soli]|uniref:hypothetical protein n=1 Tax=Salinimicrobium soli TaxID=1254399 RepID=UPI003AAF50D0